MDISQHKIRPGRADDAPVLARLMSEELNSRLTSLGSDFVLLIHQHLISSRYSLCIVAEEGKRILGYAAALIQTDRFYSEFLWKKGIKSAFIILPRLIYPKNLRTFLSGLAYFNQPSSTDPGAELISLVISPEARRSGLGKALFYEILDELQAREIKALKITTAKDNMAANAFYNKIGSLFIRSEPLYHDRMINVYFHDIHP